MKYTTCYLTPETLERYSKTNILPVPLPFPLIYRDGVYWLYFAKVGNRRVGRAVRYIRKWEKRYEN